MNKEQFFIEHCENVFENMEFGGNEVAHANGFDVDVNKIVEQGRKELQIFKENNLEVEFLFTEDGKELTPILCAINEALLFVGLMESLGLNF